MKFVCNLVILLISVTALVGCHPTPAQLAMDKAASIMESRPDSAMALLDSIDFEMLRTRQDKARFALLKSMALDKNYVDKTDFDVLQPAIDYYLRKGTPDEKLMTYYYQGRIYQNQGDRDQAFGAFARGLDIAEECKDSLLVARTLIAQGCIYHELYDFKSLTHNYLRAAKLSNMMDNEEYEFDCLLVALNGLTILRNKKLADSVDLELRRIVSDDRTKISRYYQYKLPYIKRLGKEGDLRRFVDSLPDGIFIDSNGLLSIASAYIKLNDNNRAEKLLTQIRTSEEPYDTLRYLALSVKLLRNQNKYEEALAEYLKFNDKSDLTNLEVLDNNKSIIEEKYRTEIAGFKQRNRQSNIIYWCIVGLLVLSLSLIVVAFCLFVIRAKKRIASEKAKTMKAENENLIHRISALEDEYNCLNRILKENNEIQESIREMVIHRLNMLNSVIGSSVTSVDILRQPYEEWEKSLKEDKDKFMKNNRDCFQIIYPDVIRHLKDKDLSDEEINYMCLYALGLNGSEIGEFLKMPSYRNKTKEIRRKLGLGVHDTNLKTYVANLFKKL